MNDLESAVELLKTNLAPVAEMGGHGWDLLVRHSFWVNGVLCFVVGAFLLMGAFVALRSGLRMHRKNSMVNYHQRDDIEAGLWAIGVILFVIGLVFLASSISNMVLPEYYALQGILNIVK